MELVKEQTRTDLYADSFCVLGIGTDKNGKEFGFYADICGEFQVYEPDDIRRIAQIGNEEDAWEMHIELDYTTPGCVCELD